MEASCLIPGDKGSLVFSEKLRCFCLAAFSRVRIQKGRDDTRAEQGSAYKGSPSDLKFCRKGESPSRERPPWPWLCVEGVLRGTRQGAGGAHRRPSRVQAEDRLVHKTTVKAQGSRRAQIAEGQRFSTTFQGHLKS